MRIITGLKSEDIEQAEPQLAEYMFDTQVDFEPKIAQGFTELMVDLRNKGLDMRYIGTPLSLSDSFDLSIADNSVVSPIDTINRSLLHIEILTADSNYATLQLQGCNTTDGTFVDVGDEITVKDVGIYTAEIFDFYSYYKIKVVSTATKTAKVYMTEYIYYQLHLYKTLYLIYTSLERVTDSKWGEKAYEYLDKYNKLLDGSLFYSDTDKDGDISDTEASVDNRIVYWSV